MAKLDKSRKSDATLVEDVDDRHVELEAALESILGIEDNSIVSASIFGVNPEDDTPGEATKPVQLNGNIKGILKLSLARAATYASNSVGIDFADNRVTMRLCIVGSTIRLYEKTASSWTLLQDLEVSDEVYLQQLPDVSIPEGEEIDPDGDPNPEAAGKHLVVNSEGEYYTHAEADPAGATTFIGLTDTAAFMGDSGDGVFVNLGVLEFFPYGGSASPWGIELQSNENVLAAGTWASIYEWVSYTGAPWAVPSVDDEMYITIPAAGFYHIDIALTAVTHELSGNLSFRVLETGAVPARGPASNVDWRTGLPVFDASRAVHEMSSGLGVQHEHSVFSCAAATELSIEALYTRLAGPSSIAFSLEMAIVKVG